MNNTAIGFLFSAFVLLTPNVIVAQEFVTTHVKSGDAESGKAAVTDFEWLAGSWGGEALGGYVEEVWTKPSGGTMLGMFKLTQDGQTIFSELMMIVPDGESIKMVLKHFNEDMTGWEEKNEVETFRFINMEGNTAYFDGLTIDKVDNGHLSIFVVMHKEDGSLSELAFRYSAIP